MEKVFYLNDVLNTVINNGSNSEDYYEDPNVALRKWVSNWDFKNIRTDLYTHKIHRYPAMFIPQLVRKLILEFSNKQEKVLDIFSGSGTLLVEAGLTERNSIGIELNPLAVLITKTKISPLDTEKLSKYYSKVFEKYYDPNHSFTSMNFKNIDFWFDQKAIYNLSKLIHSIQSIEDLVISRFLLVSLSEIIREVSFCKHSGFKMHRDKKKLDMVWGSDKLFNTFHKTFIKNLHGMMEYQNNENIRHVSSQVIRGDSRILQDIDSNSIDLIITSPPYGDSRTTVAYGQFSRLSSQWLGLDSETEIDNIAQLDNELLGGKIQNISFDENIFERSITLTSVREIFKSRLSKLENNQTEYKKLAKRFKEVISFYIDLDDTLKNAAFYLKMNKFFILVTGSRIVKEVKLHTDIIISELGVHHGFELTSIFYRNIINKRMPSKISASNIVGDKTDTMSKESIIVLKKIT